MRALLPLLCLLALAGCGAPEQQQAGNEAAAAQAGPVKGVDRSRRGKAAPAAAFKDPDGGEASLADFRGKPLLLNLWATWCAPCVKELPTLDRLARGNQRLQVLAVSQDSGPQPSVDAFLGKLEVPNLGAYHDPQMALSAELGAEVLPTTLLFDAEGREVWRYVGDLDWTGEDAARLLAEAAPGTP